MESASVGCAVVFGSYEQDFDQTNGDEALEWIVLDRRDDKVLLLSRYGLDVMQYHDRAYVDVTWENSFVREWLHQKFYAKAFSTKERKMIVKTVNKNGDGAIADTTEDYVFLLSAEEVLNGKAWDGTPYFESAAARITIPTAEDAYSCWLYRNDEYSEWVGITTEWWLRTAGNAGMYADVVTKSGMFCLAKEQITLRRYPFALQFGWICPCWKSKEITSKSITKGASHLHFVTCKCEVLYSALYQAFGE